MAFYYAPVPCGSSCTLVSVRAKRLSSRDREFRLQDKTYENSGPEILRSYSTRPRNVPQRHWVWRPSDSHLPMATTPLGSPAHGIRRVHKFAWGVWKFLNGRVSPARGPYGFPTTYLSLCSKPFLATVFLDTLQTVHVSFVTESPRIPRHITNTT